MRTISLNYLQLGRTDVSIITIANYNGFPVIA